MLVVEAIGLGLQGLEVALVLLEFAVSAIFFSSASSFYGLEIALFGAKNGGDEELCFANGVEARLSAHRALGARGTLARGAWRLRDGKPRGSREVRSLSRSGLRCKLTVGLAMRLVMSSTGMVSTRTRGVFTHLLCWRIAMWLAELITATRGLARSSSFDRSSKEGTESM